MNPMEVILLFVYSRSIGSLQSEREGVHIRQVPIIARILK